MPGRKKKETAPVNKLLEALKFVLVAQSGKTVQQTYCMVHGGQVVAFDGTIAAGHPVDVELECCPQTRLLAAALESAGPDYQIVQLPDLRLELTAGEYRVSVPISDGSGLVWRTPSAAMVSVGGEIRDALKIVGGLISDKADLLVQSLAVLGDRSAMATDRELILEAWHGYELPHDFLIPKAAIKAIGRIKKPLVSLGWTDNTLTFNYEDGCWIQTQLYIDKIPDSRPFLDSANPGERAPSNLVKAIEAVLPFGNGSVVCEGRFIRSYGSALDARQAMLDVEMPARIYNGNALAIAAEFMAEFDASGPRFTTFHNATVRGAICHTIHDAAPVLKVDPPAAAWDNNDCHSCQQIGCCSGKPCCGECIPF